MRTIVAPFTFYALLLLSGTARADRLVLVAGGGSGSDGPATQAKLHSPFGVDVDRDGNLYLVEFTGGNRVRRVDPKGNLTTIAGTGEKGNSGDGGPALQAQFDGMHSLALGPNHDLYVADTWNNRVRKIDLRDGTVQNFAGTGKRGFGGDGGPADQATFGNVYCVAFDPSYKNMYLADLDNRRIRRIDMATKTVSTVAGSGQKGVPKDGTTATEAPLVDPRAVAADANGNVYILERGGHCLRVVDSSGKIRTVAGTGQKGVSGDGGDALKATFNGPKHLCIDRDGNVVIADTENHVIRKYLPREGKIVRIAGSGKKGTAGLGGPPEQAELSQPHGVFVDAARTLYIADSSNHRVLRIER